MMRCKVLILSAILFTILITCKGQSKLLPDSSLNFSFNHLSEKDGLQAEFIIYMMKDSRGFLWLCANPGLFRYDGKTFKHYSFSFQDSTTISNNRATHIVEDKDGFLWVSTDDGLNRYDYQTDKFTRFQHNPNDSSSLPSTQVNRTILDSKGRIWAGTPYGLALFHEKTQSFSTWNLGSSVRLWIWDLIPDKIDTDILWTVGDEGLYQFRISSQTFTHFSPPDNLLQQKNKIANRSPSSFDRIYEDDEGNLWMGNRYAKLFKFEKKEQVWKSYLLEKSERGGTSAIFPYDNDHLWCSGYYPSIKIFNKRTGSVTSIDHDPHNLSSPPSQVFHIYRDNEGIIWFTTNYQISKLDPYLNYFEYNELDIEDAILTSVETTEDIFMAMNNVGVIYRMNKSTGIFTKITIPKKFALNDRITASSIIYNQQNGDLWLATTHGILVINPQTGITRSFEEMYSVTFNDKLKQVNALFQDSNGDVWIGLYYGGLYKFLIKENRLINTTSIIQSESNSPKQLRINDLKEDKNGTIWVATNSGLKLLDKKNNLVAVDAYIQNAKLLNTLIVSMVKDVRDNIWLSLKGIGLVEIVIQKPKAMMGRNFGKADGMSDDMIETFAFDSSDNLWAVSHNGLIQIDLKNDVIKNYNQLDGLGTNNMNNYSILSSKNGLTYLFKPGGFFTFNSSLFPKKNIPPPVNINSISVLQRDSITIYPGTIKSLTLKHDENYVSFTFSVLNFSKPPENKYQYQLEGLQEYWVKRDYDQNVATYTNLEPGTYTFHVKGSNQDNVWNEQGASFEITILPPPWKTWWAYTLYIALLFFLTYYIWRRAVTRSHLKTLSLIKSVEAENLREVNTIKSRFFANISHEFRTPLTLILNPLQKRIEKASHTEEKVELTVIQRNATRLLTLVNQLLDLSRAEAGTLKLKCVEGDLYNAVLPIASQFDGGESISLFFDPDKLENIITNLLSNAFKFTSAGGSITLLMNTQGPSKNFKNGCAQITIADTGTGIESQHLSKIFDRFYQVDMSATRAYEGSGIGLSLTKELVELHRGTIEAHSEFQKGTTFIIRLPLGNDHLNKEEIAEVSAFEKAKKYETPVQSGELELETPKESIAGEDSILIIEDNVELRTYLRNELRHTYKIIAGVDGEDGISIALREIPTLIICDLMMPKKDGLMVCQELKEDERTSHIPIILLTAKADVESTLSGLRHGADDYIAKPFNLVELQLRIQNFIILRKKLRAKFSQQLTVLPSEIPVESADGRFLKKAVECIEAHLTDTGFGVEPLAKALAVSQTQLYRKLQAVTGSGPNEFIRHIRLIRAADLLRNKAGNVSEVAYQVGLNNLSYFSKVFKEKFGVTPLEFLKNPIKA